MKILSKSNIRLRDVSMFIYDIIDEMYCASFKVNFNQLGMVPQS